MEPVPGSSVTHTSPSTAYSLEIVEYSAGPETWNYSRGIVRKVGTGEVIADVKRNLAGFWFTWVLREDGEYLLCGEDYQGYNAIDLRRERNVLTVPPEAHNGDGFCWSAAYPSPTGLLLAVEGCYWGGPYDLVVYDFSDPCRTPLPEIARVEEILRADAWLNEKEFAYTVESGKGTLRRVWHVPSADA